MMNRLSDLKLFLASLWGESGRYLSPARKNALLRDREGKERGVAVFSGYLFYVRERRDALAENQGCSILAGGKYRSLDSVWQGTREKFG
jgi:hypothetical protein